jgi:phospholipid-binding lipoprotein MlaA
MRMATTPIAVRQKRVVSAGATIAVALMLAGCASGPDRRANDPLEPMNRQIFKFNDAADKYVARPIAETYVKVTPAPARTAIDNFFSNIGDIGNFVNNLLQLKFADATQDFVRFAFNSTFGLGGLLDWATASGLPKHNQDFGLTLGHYGVPAGPYLVLPLLGPSSVRDSTSWIASYPLNPATYLAWQPSVALWGVHFMSARADLLGATDILSQAALDKYAFVRDAYTQRRQYLLTGSNGAALPDYGDGAANTADPAQGASATAGAAAAAAAGGPASGGGSKAQGLPTYADPAAPKAAPAGDNGSGSSDVPQYTDPGAGKAAAPAN